MMREITEAASVLYAPALAEVIGFELIPDKPRIRGCILVTFRDERGALVTIRLLRTAADGLLRALETGAVGQITDINDTSLPDLIEGPAEDAGRRYTTLRSDRSLSERITGTQS
jgi:hypothetical protein